MQPSHTPSLPPSLRDIDAPAARRPLTVEAGVVGGQRHQLFAQRRLRVEEEHVVDVVAGELAEVQLVEPAARGAPSDSKQGSCFLVHNNSVSLKTDYSKYSAYSHDGLGQSELMKPGEQAAHQQHQCHGIEPVVRLDSATGRRSRGSGRAGR